MLAEVTHEEALETDAPVVTLDARSGRINGDLTIGVDLSIARGTRQS